MASINDMIQYGVIKVGDTIEFMFKSNYFSAKILRGGLIGDCKLLEAGDNESKTILEKTVAFSSLTAWTEACLQDIMDEYYTRYSSWKRVTHHESKRSMGDLRDQCKLLDTKKGTPDDQVELYKEILRLHNTIEEMNTYIIKLHNGEKLPLKTWSFLNINPSKTTTNDHTIKHDVNIEAHNRIQDIICNGKTAMLLG